ncbi:MAG: glycosyltransferase family 2 protein, partial [Planctomycetes bacterium]|nr:glycosyltransferase family 2 protein [Planctomycetota bacterium]
MMQHIEGDTLSQVGEELEISVICPFYNEEQIIGAAIRALLQRLHERLHVSWELIVVNDGSRDGSLQVARDIARTEPKLRVLSYPHNRGRGHALRTGIHQARGRILVTTEIDLSWGEDIVERLYQAMLDNPDVDITVASPHMPGGGYKNVPAKRVWISKFGNHVIRACMSSATTMN